MLELPLEPMWFSDYNSELFFFFLYVLQYIQENQFHTTVLVITTAIKISAEVTWAPKVFALINTSSQVII